MNRLLLPAIVCALWCATTVSKAQGTHERIVMTEAGTLRDALLDRPTDRVDSLTLSGPFNSEDLQFLSEPKGLITYLSYLDMSEAKPIADGKPYHSYLINAGFSSTKTTHNYIYAEANSDEEYSTSFYGRTANHYRNDLSYAFCKFSNIKDLWLPKVLGKLGEHICDDMGSLERVTLPPGVTAIGEYAFYNCFALKQVDGEESVEVIGDYAFSHSWSEGRTAFADFDFSKVTHIGSGAFAKTSLTSFSGANVTYVGEYAFCGSAIATVTVPPGLTALPAGIFGGCSNLKDITIPGHIQQIGNKAFARCDLAKVELGNGIRAIGDEAFAQNYQLSSVTLPASIEEIGSNAFQGTAWSGSLPAEDGIVYIGNIAYQATEKLRGADNVTIKEGTVSVSSNFASQAWGIKALTLPSTLKYIGNNSFSGLPLQRIALPEGLRKIGVRAFANTGLSSVTIPTTVEQLGHAAFGGCPALVRLNYNAIHAVTYDDTDGHYGELLNAFSGSDAIARINLGDRVKRIPNGLFYNRRTLERVQLPATVEIISENAFHNCEALADMELPTGLTTIEEYAFYGCSKLSLMGGLPHTVTTIGNRAFYNCKMMQLTALPDALTSVGDGAFAGCDALRLTALPDGLTVIPQELFSNCPSIALTSLPSGVTIVGDRAFEGCTALQISTLPNSVTTIGKYAFRGCSSIGTLALPHVLDTIGAYAFAECSSLDIVRWPVSLRELGSNAFSNCGSLTNISIPMGVEKLKNYVFGDCKKVETIFLPASLKEVYYHFFGDFSGAHTFTCMAMVPPAVDMSGISFNFPWSCNLMRVPAEAVEAYKADKHWGKVKQIVALDALTPQTEQKVEFARQLAAQTTSLTDTIVGNVYYTLPEGDGYDAAEQCVVLNSTMTEAQMTVAAMLNYGQDDVAAHFNGMMIEVPAGDGTLELDVHTLGNATLGVKVGQQEARLITQGNRGKAQVSYSTDVPSNLYIYAAAPQGVQPQTASSKPLRLAASANSVKLYSFSLGSASTAIETPTIATSSVKAYYDLEGRRVSSPQGKGIYIVKMRNGTAKKVLVR